MVDKKGRTWRPSGEFSWTDLAIALFALLAVVVAALTYCSVREYTEISSKTFEAANRPYLVAIETHDAAGKPVAPLTVNDADQTVCINLTLSNEGTVPAYRIRNAYEVRFRTEKVRFKSSDPVEHYIAPHGKRGTTYCPQIGYSFISQAMKTRIDNVPFTFRITLDYTGVTDTTYHYYQDARYDNAKQDFIITGEGEGEDPSSNPKP